MLRGNYVLFMNCDEAKCKRPRDPSLRSPVTGRLFVLTIPDVGLQRFEGPDAHDCVKQARHAGWRLHRDGRCTCPWCSGRARPEPDDRAAAPLASR